MVYVYIGDLLRTAGTVSGNLVGLSAGGADGDIGASGAAIQTAATTIAFAGAGTGDVFITEADGASISGTTGSGNIAVTSTTGDLTIGGAISTGGNVDLTATAGDLLWTAGAVTGNVLTLAAGGADGDIGASGAAIQTSANTIGFTGTGTGDVYILEAAGATVSGTTGSGVINVTTVTGDLTIGGNITTTGNVTLAASGDLLRTAGTVSGNLLTLGAGGGDGDIGASGAAIQTTASTIAFTGAGTGDVFITEADGASVSGTTGSGAINVTSTTGDLTVGGAITTTGNVTLAATAGDLLWSAGTVSGNLLTLSAGGADGDIGASGAALQTAGGTIAFTGTGTGDVYLLEADGATVSGTTGSGVIDVRSTTGDLTIGGNIATTGNVLLQATAGDLLRTAGTISGNLVTLNAGGADGDIGGLGTDLQTSATTIAFAGAGTGDVFIIEADGASVSGTTGSGAIRVISSSNDLTIGGNIATTGNVTLTATTGDLLRTAGTVSGNLVTLSAGGADGDIGANGAEVQTAATTIQFAGAGTGDVFILEADGATVSGTTGSGAIDVASTAGDLTLGGNVTTTGNVDLTASAGDILWSAGGVAGNVLTFTAGGADGDIGALGSPILTLGTTIAFTGAGTGDVYITELNGASVSGSTGSGIIRVVSSNNDLTLGGNITTTGNVTLQASAGDLIRTAGTVSGNVVTLNAGAADGDIGASGAEIQTSASTIVFSGAGTGDVYVVEADGALLNGTTGSGAIDVTSTTGDLVTIGAVGTTGNVDLTALAGDLLWIAGTVSGNVVTLTAGGADGDIGASGGAIQTNANTIAFTGTGTGDVFVTDATSVSVSGTTGSGNVTLIAVTGDLTIGGNVTTTGDVTLTASGGDLLRTAGTVSAAVATLTANGVDGDIGASGAAIQTDASTISFSGAGTGDVYLVEADGATLSGSTGSGVISATTATGNFELGAVSTTGNVDITASAGALTDADGNSAIGGALVDLTAQTGIGTALNRINTAATTLDLAVTGAGDLYLDEADGATLSLATTFAGSIDIVAGGNLALGSITANGAGESVTLNTTGAIDDDNDDSASPVVDVTAETVSLTAQAGIGGSLPVEIDADNLSVVNSGTGDVDVEIFGGDVVLAGAIQNTAPGGALSVTANDGDLTLGVALTTAGGNVTLAAADRTGDGDTTPSDLIINFGINTGAGTVTLQAADDVLVNAPVSSTGSVTITADASALDTHDAGAGDANGSINGAGLVTGGSVALFAGDGIGNVATMNVATPSLQASTVSGNIDLNNAAPSAAIAILSVTGGAGDITYDQSNGQTLGLTASTVDGSVTVSNDATITATSVDVNGAAGDLSLTTSAGNIVLVAVDVANDAIVTSAGSVTDAAGAAVTVANNATFNGASITLTDNANELIDVGGDAVFVSGGGITVASAGTANFGTLNFAGAAVSINEDSSTVLAGVNTATAGLTLVSSAGISDGAGVGTDLTVTGGNASFTGTVIDLGGETGEDTNFQTLTFNGTAVSIDEDSTTTLVGASVATTLNLVSALDIVENDLSTDLSVSGDAHLTAANDITLGDVGTGLGRDTNFGTLEVDAGGDVSIIEDSATVLAGDSQVATLTLTAAGTITQQGGSSVTVDGNTVLTATIGAAEQDITLTETNNDFGAVSGTVTVADANNAMLRDTNDIDIGGTTVNALTVIADGAVTDTGNLGVIGVATFQGSTITLGGAGETTNFGFLNFNSAGAVTIQEDSGVTLSGSNTADTLSLIAAGGSITEQDGSALLNVTTLATFAAGGNDVILDNGHTLNTVSANNVGVLTLVTAATDSDGILLDNISATTLNVTTTDGDIASTVAGVLNITGDSTFTTNGASASITIDNANTFGGSVSFAGADNVTVRDTTQLNLDASNIPGNLNVTADGITTSGTIIVGGTATFDAEGNSLDLTNGGAGNNFNELEVTDALDLTVEDIDAIELGDIIIGGDFSLIAAGDVTTSGAQDITGTTTILTTAGNVTVNGDFVGAVDISSAGDVTLTDTAGDLLVFLIDGANVTIDAAGAVLEETGDGGTPDAPGAVDIVVGAGGVLDIQANAIGDATDALEIETEDNAQITLTAPSMYVDFQNEIQFSSMTISGGTVELAADYILVNAAFNPGGLGTPADIVLVSRGVIEADGLSTSVITADRLQLDALNNIGFRGADGDDSNDVIGSIEKPILLDMADGLNYDVPGTPPGNPAEELVGVGFINAQNFDGEDFNRIFDESGQRIFVIANFTDLIASVQGSFITAQIFTIDSSQFRADLNIFGVDGAGLLLPHDQCEDEESADCAKQ